MKEKIIIWAVTMLVAVAGVVCLVRWFAVVPDRYIAERLPRKPAPGEMGADRSAETVDIEGHFETFDGVSSDLTGRWPRFRGDGYDNVCRESIPLAESWERGGPPVLWSVDLGDGYAGAAVLNGRVYVLDYDEERGGDALRCFSADDGREIWRRWYKVRIKRNHGMSRTVPAVTDKYVVTMGPKCHVLCVNAVTGDFLWGLDLVKQFGATVPLWYTGQCPLIDNDIAVIAPGGDVLMMGVDCATGNPVWTAENMNGWTMSHSSIMPMTFKGRKMYVYCAIGGMVGVSARGSDRGSILWETREWKHSVVAPSPVILDEGRIFVTAGYGAGSMMFQLREEEGRLTIKRLYDLDRKVFACEQHTPVFYRGHLFTVMPNDAGSLKRQLTCLRPDGRLVWKSGKESRFGLGPFMVADDKIFVLSDDGVLTLARASVDGYEQLAAAKVLAGRDAWAPMAIADGRLFLRDFRKMICLDVAAR